MQELDERKRKILNAIIRNYLDTGEPVGSRTISKYSDLNLSSATIRNEMSDLEELGYILQPHTSAGRIPSDQGYRFYVDNLMREKDQEVTEMKEFMIEHTERMEQVLQQMAKMLAANTNYTAMITSPVSYTHLRAHETQDNLVCRLLLEKNFFNDTATTEIYTMAVVGSVRCV